VLERTLGEYEIDAVFHLAAQTIVGVANRNAVDTFDTNVRGTWSLLEACHRSPLVGRVVVASSDKAYGAHERLPYTEDTPLRARKPYDVSKACADMITTTYAEVFDVPVAVTRCGNFFGGGDLNWSRIVPGTIRSVVRGERPVLRSDGTSLRDYIFVEDAVDGYLALAERVGDEAGLAGAAINLSTESPQTALDLCRRILELMSSSLEPDVRADGRHEIPDQHLDATLAHDVLDWKPRFGLDEGLVRTIEWYRGYFGSTGEAGA
jgi:CDP-glucose 4,6-dehydratase